MSTRSGYAVTIRGFIPVVPSDLPEHGKAIAEINEAKILATGTIGAINPDDVMSADPMFRRMTVESFEVKPVTRRGKEEGGEA